MYKLFAVWTNPAPGDVEAFERHYTEVHAPLAASIPGVRKMVLTRTVDALGEEPSPLHRITELWFDDDEALAAAAVSAEGQATIADAAALVERFGVELTSTGGTCMEQPLTPGGARS